MSETIRSRIAGFRSRRRVQRRAFGIVFVLLGLVILSYAVWARAELLMPPPSQQSPDAGSVTALTEFISSRAAAIFLSAAAGAILWILGVAMLLTRDATDFVLEALEETLDPPAHPTATVTFRMAYRARFVLTAVLAGASLTVWTAALDFLGGPLGLAAARVLGAPAILWSNVAYSLRFYLAVNGLLADPGGMFCFASAVHRLTTHYISSFPAFTVFSAVLLLTRSAIRRTRSRKH